MRTGTAALIAAGVLLAGCSAAGEPATPEGVADTLGCEYVPGNPDPLTESTGTCQLGGATVTIRDFGRQEWADQWWELGEPFGVTPDDGVSLGLIYVSASTDAALDDVREALG